MPGTMIGTPLIMSKSKKHHKIKSNISLKISPMEGTSELVHISCPELNYEDVVTNSVEQIIHDLNDHITFLLKYNKKFYENIVE